MPPTARCGFCGKGPFPTRAGLSKHIQRVSSCREASKKELDQYIANIWQDHAPGPTPSRVESSPSPPLFLDDALEHLDPTILDANIDVAEHSDAETAMRPTVEEVPHADESDPLRHNSTPRNTFFVERYPAEAKAGAAWGSGTPKFEAIRQERAEVGKDWGPFEDEDEWQLAEWLIQNVGQIQTDKFLKLPIVS
jgi:hypothetical protein